MKTKFALAVSFIFHPMIISLAVFSVLIFSGISSTVNPYLVLLTCFVFSNLIPITTVVILKLSGRIDDLDASIKDQRQFPLTLGIGYTALGFISLTLLNANPLTQGLMFCYMTNTVLTLLINRFWKISIHSMGVSGPAAALWANGNHYPFLMISFIVLVSYSRVILKAHTPAQVFAGALLGLCSTYLQLQLFFL
ncbi:MAG TPA: phosphatase PAP2 family protein [Candidatus Marinimicrobia bacterium]|nr:phosphatase PAP2 family protein [Candidatus Neomarinimicrobiota bacterium]